MANILIILDQLEELIYSRDTSYQLGLEAHKRGHKLFYTRIDDLSVRNGISNAYNRQFEFIVDSPHYKYLSDWQLDELDSFDLVLMRKDPPFDLDFYFATQYLSLAKKVLVLNNPHSLRERVEKLYPFLFPGIFPPSLISRNKADILEFMSEHKQIVIKPVNDRGGSGVLLLSEEDVNARSAIELLSADGSKDVFAQLFLPEIRTGDIRAFTLDGKYVAGLKRVPSSDEIRSNLHIGGRGYKAELTAKQKELMEIIESQLKQDGLYFCGIDLIGDYITEINITSPTGITALKQVGGEDVAKLFWDGIDI